MGGLVGIDWSRGEEERPREGHGGVQHGGSIGDGTPGDGRDGRRWGGQMGEMGGGGHGLGIEMGMGLRMGCGWVADGFKGVDWVG